MSKTGLGIIAGIAIVTLLYLVYLAMTFEAPSGTTTVVIPPPAIQPVVEEPEPISRQISLPQNQLQPEPTPPPVAATDVVIQPPPVEVVIEPEPEPVVEVPVPWTPGFHRCGGSNPLACLRSTDQEDSCFRRQYKSRRISSD